VRDVSQTLEHTRNFVFISSTRSIFSHPYILFTDFTRRVCSMPCYWNQKLSITLRQRSLQVICGFVVSSHIRIRYTNLHSQGKVAMATVYCTATPQNDSDNHLCHGSDDLTYQGQCYQPLGSVNVTALAEGQCSGRTTRVS
jgi:hypothetical protein